MEKYEIMHMGKIIAKVSTSGDVRIYQEQFMPYDLYLEEIEMPDIDVQINNLNNFYHWCASRVLSLDRAYAKEILNSIGVAQAVTDKERAKISMSYHCVSLTDVYWVKKEEEIITFSELNLYDNPLNEAIVELSLKGRQMTVTNRELAPDLSTKGCFPKAWIRTEEGFKLLKDGGADEVRKELLASKICQCFEFKQVVYNEYYYDGEMVTESKIISSKEYSMVSKMAFDIYAVNHDLDTLEVCREIDRDSYYGMNILDYLTGNTDRHPENWGFYVDNNTNKYISLYPLMDFNQCFGSYDTIDGANCQTVLPRKMTQKEAAIEAVKVVGLKQIAEVDMKWFDEMEHVKEMFLKRLNILKEVEK
ncbi:MAG: hypothetical protein IKY94_06065 [Lachnospiraceae bacterium]|nr:hypothetical protein [Lachnospiraceae bacterium]